ncbi:MAG: hypothetical protein H0X42_02580 [Solirubrobacterales bacterium]|nr:hypothetical protein [Solirubrobacterales bacterium]
MRKRSILIAGLAAVAAAAIVASAALAAPLGPTVAGNDGNTQAIGAVIAPKRLAKTAFTPGTLEVTTKTTTTTAANGVPSPAVHAVIDFDRNARLFTKGIPTCDPALLQSTSTEIAEEKCGKAKIGSGTASALLPVGSQVYPVNQIVTAFNGVPQGGKPVVILHTYGTTPIQTTLVLVGTVSNYDKEGYGPRLDLEIPKIAGGTGALTDFTVKISKKYKYKGKPASFISAKCPSSKKLKARAAFTYLDGESITASATQTCAQAPEPKVK